jgi:hypothetical protein
LRARRISKWHLKVGLVHRASERLTKPVPEEQPLMKSSPQTAAIGTSRDCARRTGMRLDFVVLDDRDMSTSFMRCVRERVVIC